MQRGVKSEQFPLPPQVSDKAFTAMYCEAKLEGATKFTDMTKLVVRVAA